jgi:phytoene dehydrogenase-like protein
VPDVVIVGGGLAGLVCAQDLTAAGVSCQIVEASDRVGGRVATDTVDGFHLDRGFQILLTAYPEVRQRLDLEALDLAYFDPGAVVRVAGRFHRVADPLRRPGQIAQTLFAPVGTLADKVRLAALVLDVRARPVSSLVRRPETTTAARLAGAGFSDGMVTSFWQPLFAGIQLDPDLEVTSRRFDLILRMLASGSTAVPRDGMGAIPSQLASTLVPGTVRLGTRVQSVRPESVELSDGERIGAKAVVVATEGPEAHRLLGSSVPDPGSRSAACCWFSAPRSPWPGPVILLDGGRSGPAKNVVVMSEVSPSYAPAGSSLIAAAVPGTDALDPSVTTAVQAQLARWFGSSTTEWTHLRTDVIVHGQPLQGPPHPMKQRVNLGDGLFVSGDHRDTASVQGAMFSGARTAESVRRALAG